MFNNKSIIHEPINNLRDFDKLKRKLNRILSENPYKKIYNQVKRINLFNDRVEFGIVVSGKDTMTQTEFNKFYSTSDINFFHSQLNRRLDFNKQMKGRRIL